MVQSSRLTVALLGCGRIAQVHQRYLAEVPEAELVAVCDADAGAGSTLAGRAATPVYASLDEMLRCAAPEVVHVLTPPATHAKLALRVLEAGAHVLIEKPMALSSAEADGLLAAARRRGLVVSADHNRWFDPVMIRARELMEAGRLGDLVGVEVFQGGASESDGSQPWKAALPGGSIHDIVPHPAYQLRHLLGPIEQVEVVADRNDAGEVVEARTLARGARGWGIAIVSMRARPATNWVRIYGTAASLEVNFNYMTLVLHRQPSGSKLIAKVRPGLEISWQLIADTVRNGVDFLRGRQGFYPGLGSHLREFYRCLARGLPVPVSAEEARDVVALCEQIVSGGRTVEPQRAVGT
jgi:predicted dehydrogenase